MLIIKRIRFPIEVILVYIHWYAVYPLSYRHLEEMMKERGVTVDHSTEVFAKISHGVRQVKYLNNIVEQDHRSMKRMTKQTLRFKSFQSAKKHLG
ncbi:DDE domain-containing protein [Nitrosomonas cryotolerans]|uniref:DDE domain-containing protein n=1 Tax=Nitrosomonas cryotolerans ATCC 49181 TaxID=1131553 RepID=A0A1N6F5Y6_9PROT|nr:DDE domain-containing protein [Nitrosomonas cryotolerans]SIN90659.1 DDE domain-containing protein [Nitrosomonas cryotolerans ATCC 49181]